MEDWYYIAGTMGYETPIHMFHDLYNVQRLSLSDIASMLKVSKECIRKKLKEHKIPRRPRGGPNSLSDLRKLAEADPNILEQDINELCRDYSVSKWTVYKLRKEVSKVSELKRIWLEDVSTNNTKKYKVLQLQNLVQYSVGKELDKSQVDLLCEDKTIDVIIGKED